jgi:hypothetical protein
MLNRLIAYRDEYWAVPKKVRGEVYSVAVVYGIFALTALWLGLSFLGISHKLFDSVRRLMPAWFVFVNLFLGPVLGAFAAGPLPVPPVIRLVFAALMFLSLSAPAVDPPHQTASFLMLGVLYLEAFWLIPRWNRWSNNRAGTSGQVSGEGGLAGPETPGQEYAVAKPAAKERLLDFVLYVGIAVALVTILLVYIFEFRH